MMNYSQENIEQLFRLLGSFTNNTYTRLTYFDVVVTYNSAWPNQLLNLNISNSELNHVLNTIEHKAKHGAIPNLLMLNVKDQTIVNSIKVRQYKSTVWKAMSHNLQLIAAPNELPNFRIELVTNKTDFEKWLAIVETELMGGKPLNYNSFSKLLTNKNCYFFLGILDNEPVATSFLFVNKSNAGVYLVSTKATHRKKGYGNELTKRCLLQAKNLKCNRVDIQATTLGEGVYSKLGFITCGAINVFRVENCCKK